MGSPAIFSGAFAKLLSASGLMRKDGSLCQNDGPKNYISNGHAQVDTTGWATYADAAGNTPVDATGGSPSSTWTRTTSSPLRGAGSFLWTRTAANRQGEGVAYAFTLDLADRASLLSISFDYAIASGTFVAADGTTPPLNDGTTSQNAGMSDLEVFVYDVTNSTLIPVTPQVLTSNSTAQARFRGIFQTSATGTSYRLVIHTARSTAVAFTALFNNFYVGSQLTFQGSPITDWVAYTPTFTGFGTPTAVQFMSRRVGDSLEVRGNFTLGTSTGVEGRVSLGYNGADSIVTSADSSKLPSISIAGIYGYSITAAVSAYMLAEQSKTYLTFGIQDGTRASTTKQNGSSIASSGTAITLHALIPIQGWSSNVTMSDTTKSAPTVQVLSSGSGTYATPAGVKYLRVRMVGGGGGGGTSNASTSFGGTGGTASTFGTSLLSAGGGGGAVGGGGPSGGAGGTSSLGTGPIGIALTGGGGCAGPQTYAGGGTAGTYTWGANGGSSAFGGAGLGYSNTTGGGAGVANTGGGGAGGAGANAAVQYTGGCGGGAGGFVDAIISSPLATYAYVVGAGGAGATGGGSGNGGPGGSGVIIVEEYYRAEGSIAATESVNARYYGCATSLSGSLATLSWTTKDYDSHGAMVSGTYTCPTPGKYQINASVLLSGTIALNNTVILEIQKNGTVVSRYTDYYPSTLTDAKAEISDIISCVAGDTLRVQLSSSITTPAFVASNYDNYCSIARVGN